MFYDENFKQSTASKLLETLLGIIIRIFLAVTTAGFFANYAADIWTWLLPRTMAANLAAITGVILIDGMAAGWTYIRRVSADTIEQQQYASLGAVLDMSLSLAVTASFVVMTTPLLKQSVSPEIYAVMLNLAAWGGIIIGVAAFAGNGVLWHYYAQASSSSLKQLRTNELRAVALQAEHDIESERLKMWTQKTISGIRGELPEQTDSAAQKTASEYINRQFAKTKNARPLSSAKNGHGRERA